MAGELTSLRERKKQRTRQQLIEISERLFRKQGYDATTLEQICAMAEVSVPTLLAYFSSKERLALASEWDSFDRLRARIEEPGRSLTTLEIWREFAIEGAEHWAGRPRDFQKAFRTERKTAALSRARMALVRAYETALAEGLATDFDTDPETDLPTLLLATMLAFGHHAVFRQWAAHGAEGDIVGQATGVVDFAIKHYPRPGSGSFV